MPYHGIQWLENRRRVSPSSITRSPRCLASAGAGGGSRRRRGSRHRRVRAAGERLGHRRDHAAGAGVAGADEGPASSSGTRSRKARHGTRHSTSVTSITTATSTSPWARSCSFPDRRRPPTGWRSGKTSGRTDAASACVSAGGCSGDSPQLGFVLGTVPSAALGQSPTGSVLGTVPSAALGTVPNLGTHLGTVPGQKTVDAASDPAVRAACTACHVAPPAGHPAEEQLARRVPADEVHPRAEAGAAGLARADAPDPAPRRPGESAPLLPQPRTRAPAAAGAVARTGRVASQVRQPEIVRAAESRRRPRCRTCVWWTSTATGGSTCWRRKWRRDCCSAPSIATASQLTILASLPHPDHVTPVDLDGDGLQDLLIADLGEFFPRDHHKGAVIWLRGFRQRQVRRRHVARRLAARGGRRGRRLQRRRQARSGRRGLRLPHDRTDLDPREQDGELRATVIR